MHFTLYNPTDWQSEGRTQEKARPIDESYLEDIPSVTDDVRFQLRIH